MDHTPFIIAAYAVTISAIGAMLAASFAWMRRAERERDGQ
jgi:hypothetical protein